MTPLAALLAPLLLLGAQVPDDVGLVRLDPTGKKGPLWIDRNAPSSADGEIVGELSASDRKWEKLGGKTPVRFAFGAQWDATGLEEIVVVREKKKKKDKRLELLVYRAPTEINGNVGKPVASTFKKDFGVAKGNGRVVAVGPVDVDGDHRDEAAVVREGLDGTLWLDVLTLPTKKKDKGIALVRSDATFGLAAGDAVVGLYGTDVDDDDVDELVVLRRDVAGQERLEILELPASIAGETGAPVLSDDDVTPGEGWSTSAFGRLRADVGEVHRPLFVRERVSGQQRLEHYELPASLHGDTGTPLDVDEDLDVSGFQLPIVAAFGVRDGVQPPEPHEPFAGPWQVSYQVEYQDQAGVVHSIWIGPFKGIVGTSDTSNYLELKFPANTTYDLDAVEGYVSNWGNSETAYFKWPGFAYGPLVHFYPKDVGGFVAAGDRITVTYPWGAITQPDPFALPLIQAFKVQFGPYIGELVAKDETTLKAVVAGYRFERVP